ncbi:hypothetical protein ILYODFUR_018954 [Ilyodon furcidens]|uniref:Ig-like domain-containing protein n=1 Tax=Ilyodon furcidens TaxID=33524 RepID=A0ABV0TKW2_9TELE
MWLLLQTRQTSQLNPDRTSLCHVELLETAAEWSRTDLEPEYVLHYRNEQVLPSLQHPSFKNRVDLQDRKMKDGDASLVLKNVSTDDRGTYQCRVTQKRSAHSKRTVLKPDLISTVYLDVAPSSPPGNKDGSDGLIPGLLILTLCVAALVGLVIYEKKQGSLSRLCLNAGRITWG